MHVRGSVRSGFRSRRRTKGRPRRLPASLAPKQSVRCLPSLNAACAASMTVPSTQPADTEPAKAPSPRTTIWLPPWRGAEPVVFTTVARATRCPSLNQFAAIASTSDSVAGKDIARFHSCGAAKNRLPGYNCSQNLRRTNKDMADNLVPITADSDQIEVFLVPDDTLVNSHPAGKVVAAPRCLRPSVTSAGVGL